MSECAGLRGDELPALLGGYYTFAMLPGLRAESALAVALVCAAEVCRVHLVVQLYGKYDIHAAAAVIRAFDVKAEYGAFLPMIRRPLGERADVCLIDRTDYTQHMRKWDIGRIPKDVRECPFPRLLMPKGADPLAWLLAVCDVFRHPGGHYRAMADWLREFGQ